MRRIFGVAAGMLAAAGLAACMPATEAKEERPAYDLARAEEGVEIRDYGARLVAEHSVRGPYRRAVEQGYIRLERYFTGENTIPEAMALTMPVMARQEADGGWTTVLPLPEGYSLETAPRPVDQRIRVVEQPPRRVAALSFKGAVGEAILREQAPRLDAWLEARGIAHRGDFTLASYDPPWKPTAWRSNEVLVTLR